MVNFLTYVYHLALKFYDDDGFQAATPILLCLAFNFGTCIVVLLRFLGRTELIGPPEPIVLAGLLAFGLSGILLVFFVLIYTKVKKKSMDEKIQEYSKETLVEKRRNEWKVIWYFILSPHYDDLYGEIE
jgi:hypothetical protein